MTINYIMLLLDFIDFAIFLSSCTKLNSKLRSVLFLFLGRSKYYQNQPSIGVLIKKCSEKMKQIYRRTSMPKCDFNKVTFHFHWNHTSAWVFSCKFAAYFQNTFSQEQLWRADSALFIHGCFKSLSKILLGLSEA